eukprot:56583-Eustigmatos_ZCMA.PRE.4
MEQDLAWLTANQAAIIASVVQSPPSTDSALSRVSAPSDGYTHLAAPPKTGCCSGWALDRGGAPERSLAGSPAPLRRSRPGR